MLSNAWSLPLKSRLRSDVRLGICMFAMTIFCAPAAYSNTTYTYIGSSFNDVSNWNGLGHPRYATNDSVHGFFVVRETLAPNLANQEISVIALALDFTDGHLTSSCAGCLGFTKIWTDGRGDIEYWIFSFIYPGYRSGWGLYTRNTPYYDVAVEDGGYYYGWSPASYGKISNSPGTWVRTVSGVPEPSSVVFMTAALLAFAFGVRRRAL